MTLHFDECSLLVRHLAASVDQLQDAMASLSLGPLNGREWFELLYRKLLPQLGEHSFLVVAVVGGTNIGKSVVFNHIAGERLSSTSPMASGTKHPTALLSPQLHERISLPEIFAGFSISPWNAATQPLEESPEHRLFVRSAPSAPEKLIILDTPDVDSVAEVNWERADHVRQAADVLVAVLTQQKYNDAAVKEFFRKAAQEDKLVIVVFNQCLLPEDEEYWPLWLGTFIQQTGVQPHSVYLAPNDRRAAEANRLPFYERSESQTAEERGRPRNLMDDLSQLRFGEIKIQALSGALRHVVDEQHGAPAWLREIASRASEFREARELLSAQRLVEIGSWPKIPNSVLTMQVREWWSRQRDGWAASVHGFYRKLGQAVSYPVRAMRDRGAPPQPPLELYRRREWESVLMVLERTLDRLVWLKELGNPLLSPRLEQVLNGASRSQLIENVRRNHDQVDFESIIANLVDNELESFRQENPQYYRLYRRIDQAAAAVRPAISVALFASGAGPFGEVVGQGIAHIVAETVGGATITAVGDKVITDTASSGAGYLEARFRRLDLAFTEQRATWMAEQLETQLLGALQRDLAVGASAMEAPEFVQVQNVIASLRQQLD